MTPFVLIRHGPTDWTAEGRIQGRSDRPLSAAGRDTVRGWRLPPEMSPRSAHDWRWLTSPLRRARETAALLCPAPGHAAARPEPALIEMHWGDWEGRRLEDLRAQGGAKLAEAEARGLDFRPPGGESPREVQARLKPLLARLAAAGRATAAVTHKGVIRALYALASGWDMTDKPPEKLHDACAHRFLLDPWGAPLTDRMNIPLTR
ncbi:MAG: histidine phosphatase family protein [Kiloniellaceae bacterium]